VDKNSQIILSRRTALSTSGSEIKIINQCDKIIKVDAGMFFADRYSPQRLKNSKGEYRYGSVNSRGVRETGRCCIIGERASSVGEEYCSKP
jgi:hypothetical protein